MKNHYLYLIALFSCLLSAYNANATHLMGGNLTYTYLGQTGSNYNYEVTLKLYRYCASGSSQLPNNMDLGIYEEDTLNPGADKNLVSSTTMPLISQQFITPPSSDTSCNFTTVVCVEEGVYQTTISVPATIGGYHLISDRCCRNNNIANLDNPSNAAQAYYAFMPPTSIINSSPTFAAAPVPFVCQDDTVSILNTAYDPDGDLLVYNFVVPYNGIASGGNPSPNPPAVYNWPIPSVTYASPGGYSVTQPFGTGTSATIDTTSGLTSYYANSQGYYVVAVEIREYRNGVLIGITRRDLQIIVIVCPINPAPQLASGGGSGQTTYTLFEGQSLCFNTNFTDPNGDSLYLTHSGDVFNSSVTNPTATITDVAGDSTISTQFCWSTGCNQGRSTPYQFSIIVNDNGCPAKTTNVVYTINVINTPKPVSMSGNDTLCANEITGVPFSVPLQAGYTFSWVINGGTQVSGTNTHSITVDFNGTGNASVSAVMLSPFGCSSDTLTKNVFVKPVPAADAGSPVTFCAGGSASLGVAPTGGVTYSWSPTTGLSSSTVSNPTVTLSTAQATNYILTTNANGCENKDTVLVTVSAIPTANAGNNAITCSGAPAQLGTIPTAGYTYSWSPVIGLSNNSIANPQLTLTNNTSSIDTFYYSVIVQLGVGCRDTDTVRVVIVPKPSADAGSDVTYCSGQNAVIGAPLISGYTYAWTPASDLSSNTVSNPTVNATNATQTLSTINYSLITTWFGCKDTDSVAVNIKPLPLSNAGSNSLLCSNIPSTLGTSSTAGYTYVWAPATGLSNVNISNPTLTLTNTDTIPDTLQYYVTTTLNGCITSDTVQIVSSPVPTAVAGSDVTFCSGQTVAIGSASVNGYSYNWLPSTGILPATGANPNLTLTNATTQVDTSDIILTVSWFGCIDKDTISAFVKPVPTSQAGPATQSLCDGDTATLGTSTTAGYTYLWTPSSLLSSSTISNPTLVVTNPGPTVDTLSYLVTTTLNGCSTSDSTKLFVNALPNVQATSTPAAICAGTSASLTGSGASTYNWATLSNPTVSIGTGASINVSPILTASYIVTGTSSATCENKDTVSVTVNQLPTVTIAALNDTICVGDTLSMSANGANTYTWFISGNPTAIGIGTSIQVSPSASTTYVLQGVDANTCEDNDTLIIVVSPAATLDSLTGTASLCPGVVGVSYWVNNPVNTSTYQWTINNGTLTNGQGTDSALVDWPNAGSGSVTVIETTDQGCQSHPVILPVTINPVLTPVAATGPQVLCANQAQGIVYNTLQTPGSSYQWQISGGTITSVNPDTNGTATVNWTATGPTTVYLWYDETSTTLTNVCFGTSDSIAVTINPIPVTSSMAGSNSICVFDTITYSVTNVSSNTYQWTVQNGSIVSGNGTNSISVVWNTSGSYSVSVSETNSFNCTGTPVAKTITVNALPIVALTATPPAICNGDTTQLLATGGTVYSWSPSIGLSNAGISNPLANPSSSTTYTVLVTDANSCKQTNNITVNVNNLPVTDAGATTAVCDGNSTTLQATATGSASYTYSWTPSTGLSNSSISNPVATPTITTLYSVVVTDNNNCSSSDTVTVFVNSLPVADAGTGGQICDGGSVQLNANGGFSSYTWTPAASLANANTQSPTASPNSPTVYSVVVTDANGCTDDDTVSVDVNAQPNAIFTIDSVLSKGATCNGVEVVFLNTSTNALSYFWDFGDGTTSTEANPTHLYNFSQGGNIVLIAYNNQCSDTMTKANPVQSLSDYLDKAPNVFTPNEDKINDCFRLGKEGAFDECSELKVFNRWGKLVFESDATNKCWNGKNKTTGAKEPEGTYLYILRVKDFQIKGAVMLIRE